MTVTGKNKPITVTTELNKVHQLIKDRPVIVKVMISRKRFNVR